jgi:hypothetical protein
MRRKTSDSQHLVDGGRSREGRSADTGARRAIYQARAEVRKSLDEAKDDIRDAIDDAREGVHQALHELREAFADDCNEEAKSSAVAGDAIAGDRADIVATAVVPESRGTEQIASASASSVTTTEVSDRGTLKGRLSATKDRAIADARGRLREKVANWLDPEVPRTWIPPVRSLEALIVGEPQVRAVQRDYGEMFEAALTIDASSRQRERLIETYHEQLVEHRLTSLGAALAFVLICLAAVSGYIRADEATKGYYTNRLRMLAAAGVGASGVILYQMIA